MNNLVFIFVMMKEKFFNRCVLNKLHEEKGKALEMKYNELNELLKPHTTIIDNGWEEVDIPNEEVALQYEKLNREFQEIVEEIRLMHQN